MMPDGMEGEIDWRYLTIRFNVENIGFNHRGRRQKDRHGRKNHVPFYRKDKRRPWVN